MNSKIVAAVGLAAVLATMLVSTSFAPAFAANVAVSITPNASTKSTDAFSPNPVKASVGDTVTWTNDDTTIHTVTSGTGSADPNMGKVFDSSPGLKTLFAPKQTFTHVFTEAGTFPYFCQLHPTMMGTVEVAAASGGGGGGSTGPTKVTATLDGKNYDIIYNSTTSKATTATVDAGEDVKVTFDKAGEVELTLPNALISGINSVTADDKTVNFTPTNNANSTTIKFTIPAGSTTVVIKGATVVPEFSVIAVAVLGISIAAIIGYTRFARNNSGIGFFGRA
jgi:plastocyanin